MNVLLVVSQFYPHQGGVEVAVQNLGIALKEQGHRVIVAAARAPRTLSSSEAVRGLTVHRYYFGLPFSTLKSTLAFPFFSIKTLVALTRLIKSQKIEVLNFHFVDNAAWYVCALKFLTQVPLVVSLHGNDVQRFPGESGLAQFILRRLLTAAEGVTVNSGYLLNEAEKVTGFDLGRAVVVGNGIHLEEFENVISYKIDKPYVLSLCRLVHKKGVDILVRAWKKALPKLPADLLLIIGGDGEERDNIVSLIGELGISERVQMVGLVKNDERLKLFKGAKLYVVPSRIEPFGIVVLEAMASGTPVLASNTGGIPSIITAGTNGTLFDNGNEDDLAEKLTLLINNLDVMSTRASRALVDVQSYSWKHVAERFVKVYEKSSHS